MNICLKNPGNAKFDVKLIIGKTAKGRKMEVNKISLANAMTTADLTYYLERILDYTNSSELSRKSSRELRDLLVDRLTHQDIIKLGLRSSEKNEKPYAIHPELPVDVDFSRTFDVGKRILDLTA